MGNVSAAGESWTVVNYIITESYSTRTLFLGATYVIHGPPGKN